MEADHCSNERQLLHHRVPQGYTGEYQSFSAAQHSVEFKHLNCKTHISTAFSEPALH